MTLIDNNNLRNAYEFMVKKSNNAQQLSHTLKHNKKFLYFLKHYNQSWFCIVEHTL